MYFSMLHVGKVIFWFAFAMIVYTYLGYPLFVYSLSLVSKKIVRRKLSHFDPFVSVVIAARNEETNIEARIRDLLEQDYPKEKLEIIVVSDGSTDGTTIVAGRISAEINAGRADDELLLRLLSYNPSRGKPSAVNMAVSQAKGDLIVFADCRQRFLADAIGHLVANFSDREVGCVSGELVFEKSRGSSIMAEMDVYWRFEKWLRKLESSTGSVPGATGAIYAIRRELFDPLPEQTLLDDVLTPLRVRMKGYRVVFEGRAVAYDTISNDFVKEKKRKIRTLAGNWQLLWLEPHLLSPVKNPLWFQYMSHKVLRLLVPYFFFLLLAAALYVRDYASLLVLFCLTLFFGMAVVPRLPGPFRILSRVHRICRAVIMLNYFAMVAPFSLVRPRRKLW